MDADDGWMADWAQGAAATTTEVDEMIELIK